MRSRSGHCRERVALRVRCRRLPSTREDRTGAVRADSLRRDAHARHLRPAPRRPHGRRRARPPQALDVAVRALEGVDRLVLLGDTLELRQRPGADALAVAEPVMRAIGDALGPAREVVIVAGNHDHALVARLAGLARSPRAPEPLSLEERVAPARRRRGSPSASPAGWRRRRSRSPTPACGCATTSTPCTATTSTCHCAIPTLEVLGARDGAHGRRGRATRRRPTTTRRCWRRSTPGSRPAPSAPSRRGARRRRHRIKAWNALEGPGRAHAEPRRAARRLSGSAVRGCQPRRPRAAAARPQRPALRRGGLAGWRGRARRLGLAPAHLVFGHTHRTGSSSGDEAGEWRTAAGTRLHNAGCWVFETHFMGRAPQGASPYWPAARSRVDETGRRACERLLGDLPGEPSARRPGRELHGVADDAGADLERELARRVALVLDEREAAGVLDGDLAAVGADDGAAAPPAPCARAPPTRPGLVAARPGAGLVRRSAPQQRAGRVLGAQRRERRRRRRRAARRSRPRSRRRRPRRSASSTAAGAVEEVARRPRRVAVLAPQHESASITTGCSMPSRATAARTSAGSLRRRIAAGVRGDDAQPVRRVALVPSAHVGQRAQRVAATEVPELDQHRAPELLVHAQARDVDPLQARPGSSAR